MFWGPLPLWVRSPGSRGPPLPNRPGEAPGGRIWGDANISRADETQGVGRFYPISYCYYDLISSQLNWHPPFICCQKNMRADSFITRCQVPKLFMQNVRQSAHARVVGRMPESFEHLSCCRDVKAERPKT
eukprot:8750280-Pyramimonas_sp.AAC.1